MTRGALLGLVAMLAWPAAADVLITQDGSRVETQGSWEVKGRQVIFTLPNGTLSAMRATEVDLEASRLATEQQDAPPPPPPPPEKPREAVLVLTNKDIPQAAPAPVAETDEGEKLQAPSEREPVQVVNWVRTDLLDGIEIRGMLSNLGRSVAAGISLQVQVKDEQGKISETVTAAVKARSLVAGSSTTFRALLTETPDFAGEPIFTVSSTGISVGGAKFATGQQAGAQEGIDGTLGAGGASGSAAAGGSAGAPGGGSGQGGSADPGSASAAGSGGGERVPPSQVNPPAPSPGYEDDLKPADVDSNG